MLFLLFQEATTYFDTFVPEDGDNADVFVRMADPEFVEDKFEDLKDGLLDVCLCLMHLCIHFLKTAPIPAFPTFPLLDCLVRTSAY